MKYLIVGLGNIGPEYAATRHNIGFMVVDALAEKYSASFDTSRLAFKTEFKYKSRHFHLIKPTTYMNASGKAMRYWMNELKVPKERTLVIVDDVALPFGVLRMRAKGSAAGHNGLKDIEQQTGGSNYPRLRFGIGDNYPKGKQVDYVLGAFDQDEQAELPLLIEKSMQMVEGFGTMGLARTMNEFNS